MGYTGEAKREYQRKWIADRRAAYFVDKVCANCGSTKRLELDHIDPAIKISSRIWSWSAERREAEISKCQVLCYECHWEKTKEQSLRRQFCAHGHDTWIIGRDLENRCIECRRLLNIAYRKRRKERDRESKASRVAATASKTVEA
jgi:hypothetical protein